LNAPYTRQQMRRWLPENDAAGLKPAAFGAPDLPASA
jgi:hypothetical protein